MVTLFLCASYNIYAQTGSVTIHKDTRLDQRINEYGEIIPPNTQAQINGYRIQLAFEQSKVELEKQRDKFMTAYPTIETYIIYRAPNFFLKAGNFRTKLEAEKIKFEVENDFPTSTVVKEKIDLPKIPSSK